MTRQMEAAMRDALSIPAAEETLAFLTSHGVTTSDLLSAFFQAIRPFVGMYSDILCLFEKIGAHHGERNLKIEFAFCDFKHPWAFDVQHFKEVVESWKQITRPIVSEEWTSRELWDLRRVFS